MKAAICLIALAYLVLAGCSVAYVAPAGGKQASLTVQNRTLGQLTPYSFADAATCSGAQKLTKGISLIGMVPGESVTVTIPAERDFSLQVWAGEPNDIGGTRSCNIVMTFTPTAGANYLALAFEGTQNCSAQVFRVVASATGENTFVKEPSVRVRETSGIIRGHGYCRT